MLTYIERKGRLPFGACARVAEAHKKSNQTVSAVLKGRLRHPAIEKALARLMEPRTTAAEAFGPAPMRSMRKTRALAGVAE